MMRASRRGFLFGAGSALLVAKPALHIGRLPKLYGDGLHDDTEAMNALVQGRPFKLADTGDTMRPLFGRTGEGVALRGGHYLLTAPLVVKVPSLSLIGLRLTARGRLHDRFLDVVGMSFTMMDCHIDTTEASFDRLAAGWRYEP